jgi:hypothetical protein
MKLSPYSPTLHTIIKLVGVGAQLSDWVGRWGPIGPMIAMLDDTLETWVGVEMKSIYYWTHEIESPTNAGLIGMFLPPAKT